MSGLKSFKEYTAPVGIVIYHFDSSDRIAEHFVTTVLTEAAPKIDLGKGRSIVHHKAHIPDGQDHLHFKVKGHNVYAVNKDGSAHDRSHGLKMQRWALDGAKTHYSNFKMPDDGLIEQMLEGASQRLVEGSDLSTPILTKAAMLEAVARVAR